MLVLFPLIIFFSFLGFLTGILTGLLPGLHVNNIALILLSLSGMLVSFFSFLNRYGVSSDIILLMICIFIVTNAISHSFHDFLPSSFLGAPDEDTALSVLPAHSLLLEGRGFEAIVYSALGSYGAILFCFLLLFPVRFIIGEPLFFYDTLREIMFFVFILSGVFGFLIFDLSVDSPIGLSSPVLFPALAGLFGTPTLLKSVLTKPCIPHQKTCEPVFDWKTRRSSILSIVTGGLGGILVSIIPGITSATGTILAMTARGESDKRQTITTISAVNTACAFFVIVMMFVILKPRSGAAIAAMELISVSEWRGFLLPSSLIYLLIAILIAGNLSYFSFLKIGKFFAEKFDKIPYFPLVKATILLVVVLVFLFTGFIGLLVLFVATGIGLLPVEWGVRRSHCMGVLLVPIIYYFH